MTFTDKEVETMQSIFKHLEPRTIESIQTFRPDLKFRTACTIGVSVGNNKYNYIYQYFHTLSPARKKIIDKRKNELPYNLYYIELENNFVCIGWKFTK